MLRAVGKRSVSVGGPLAASSSRPNPMRLWRRTRSGRARRTGSRPCFIPLDDGRRGSCGNRSLGSGRRASPSALNWRAPSVREQTSPRPAGLLELGAAGLTHSLNAGGSHGGKLPRPQPAPSQWTARACVATSRANRARHRDVNRQARPELPRRALSRRDAPLAHHARE